ncbi:MAG: DMT family transporter [Pseudomonadota bacterium]
MQHNRTAYLLLFLTTLFWGGNAVAGKLAVGHISPLVLTSLRWAIAFTILAIIGGKQFWQERHLVRPHLPLLFVYGALGFSIFNIALYSALNHTTAINVAIEQAGVPAVIFLGNYILFRTRVTLLQILGFGLSIVGVAVVASQGSLERLAGLQINRGDAFMVLGILCYSAYSVLLKYKPALHWKSMMLVMAFSAFLISLPFSYWELQGPNGLWPDTQGWIITMYTAILPAIVSQVFWIRGVEMIGANRAGIFINLVPILGTLLAIAVLGEVFQLYHAIALALVIGGIWIAENSGRKANNG